MLECISELDFINANTIQKYVMSMKCKYDVFINITNNNYTISVNNSTYSESYKEADSNICCSYPIEEMHKSKYVMQEGLCNVKINLISNDKKDKYIIRLKIDKSKNSIITNKEMFDINYINNIITNMLTCNHKDIQVNTEHCTIVKSVYCNSIPIEISTSVCDVLSNMDSANVCIKFPLSSGKYTMSHLINLEDEFKNNICELIKKWKYDDDLYSKSTYDEVLIYFCLNT